MFGKLKRFAKKALKNPLVKNALKSVPVVGTAYAAYDTVSSVSSLLGGGGSGRSSLPALPSGMPSMRAAPAMALPLPGTVPGMGRRSIFRDDPNVPANIEQFAIPQRELRVYYRAPKGFVVLRDPNGQAFGVPKAVARNFGWRPARKPPISVGDWRAVQRADRTVKKMKKIFRQTTAVDRNVSGGKVVVTKRKKACK